MKQIFTTKIFKNSVPLFAASAFSVLLLLSLGHQVSNAQVVFTEGFEFVGTPAPTPPTLTLPLGWSQGKDGAGADPDNYWERINLVNSGFNGPTAAHGGTVWSRFRSGAVVSGEGSMLVSRPYDLSAGGVLTGSISFWMWRDGTNTWGSNDSVRVFVDTIPDLSGSPTLLTTTVGGYTSISRYSGVAPTVTANTWNQYSYTIPASYNTPAPVYVILVATSRNISQQDVTTRPNIHIDDFSITTYPSNQTGITASVDAQNTATTQAGAANQEIIRLKITVTGDGDPLNPTATRYRLDDFTFNTNGCTNWNNDVNNAKLWYTGGTPALDVTNAILINGNVNTGWLGNYVFLTTALPGEGLVTGTYTFFDQLTAGDNYFWITYDLKPGATGGNFVDAEWLDFRVDPPGAIPPAYQNPSPQTLPGSREIDLIYCIPSMIVGTAWAGYTNNDYVAHVRLQGDVLPGIDNNKNSNGPNAGACTGIPTTCPFSAHPPDYELFPPNPGYTATLTADNSTPYQIQIRVGTWFSSNYVAAWIDFNKDGIFNNTLLPAVGGEKLTQSPSLTSNAWHNSAFFTVPFSSSTGNLRLRVREVYARSNIDPCATYTYGETEDYTVTILPPCAPAWAGWKTWLGYTDDWDNPSNWCGGVPTINDNARLPAGFTGSTPYTYVRPKIKAGVLATTKTLRIEPGDTLYIDAAANSSLHVSDTLSIHNNSLLTINSTFIDTAQVNNGLLNASNINAHPFKGTFPRVRNIWTFTQAELLAQGLQPGDEVFEMLFHIRRTAFNNVPYQNVKIKVYYTTFLHCFITSTEPVPIGVPVTVYNGNFDHTPIAQNTSGTVTIPLSTPFLWNGSTDKLVVDISYDMTGLTVPSGIQYSSHTQTVGCASYTTLYNNFPVVANPETYSGGTAFGPVFGLFTEVRPNITFRYDRPYEKYPIEVNGHWHNDGNFVAGMSEVTMKLAVLPQLIKGLSSTTFYDLVIDNTSTVSRLTDFSITDTLTLQTGRLRLNGGTVHMLNPDVGSLVRVAGGLESETNTTPYGEFHWNLGTQPGVSATIPFMNTINQYIPVTYNMDAGSHDMYFATYATGEDNLPIPAELAGPPAPVVSNINGYNGLDNSNNMVDRFWKIYNQGSAYQADITFRYGGTGAASEEPFSGNAGVQAQRWVLDAGSTTPGQGWENPAIGGQSFAPAAVSAVTVNDFNLFNENIWWALVNNIQPLPVELLTFTAEPVGDAVRLNWSTASEINNDYFEVERTVNMSEFSFIDRVQSLGSTTVRLDYETWDMDPVNGMQYYFLRQYDLDGKKTSYGPVGVNMRGASTFDIVTASVKPSAQGITVFFNYDSQEPYSYMLVDLQGRVVAGESNQKAAEGFNMLEINAPISHGIYQVVLQNSEKVVTRKLFY